MSMSPMNTSEIIQALTPIIEVFDRFGIAYYIGGSVASSVHGRRRYTQDVDVVAALQLKHVQTKEKHAALDIAYLRQSAPMLGIADLLEKAFNDAGLQTP